MPEHAETTSTKAVIVAAEPQLFVADIKTSCDFFTAKLGFAVAFSYGEPPFYAQVKRDGARLNLRCLDRPAIDPALQRSRGIAVGIAHGRDRGRDQAAVPRVPGGAA